MLRNEFVLMGCGGAGNKLVDTILNVDPRFVGYFINSSITDIRSLDHYDDIDKNYMCISNQNGAGRDRNVGKRYANKHGWNILERIKAFDQTVIYLVTSLGGGSGSSIVSVILKAIRDMKESGEFDKIVNLIGILPNLDSSNEILENTMQSWDEIMSYNVVNNMIFIDNNRKINGTQIDEQEINEIFANLFDSIFEIPVENGRTFDNANLSKVLKSKGYMYIYNLPDDCHNVGEALQQTDSDSVLANIFENKDNTIIDEEDNNLKKVKCSYVGTSFNNEKYLHDDVLRRFKWGKGDFTGYNLDSNLVLISGLLPPLYSIQVIKAVLEDRKKHGNMTNNSDFSKYVIGANSEVSITENNSMSNTNAKHKISSSKSMKDSIKNKKSLFDMY